MLQKSQRRSGQFLAKERNERQSPINTASNPLRESPVSLARGDLSPHIIIQSPRLRGGEFESHLQKRLLQQYLPEAEGWTSIESSNERASAQRFGSEPPREIWLGPGQTLLIFHERLAGRPSVLPVRLRARP